MKHSKKLLIFLLSVMLVIATVMSVVACTPPADDKTDGNKTEIEETVTENLPIANGKFANSTGSAYVKSATGWTLSSGVWSKSATGLVTGVIDLSQEAFANNKGTINSDLAAPSVAPGTPKDENGAYKDTNALVISMSGSENDGSAYYYSGKSTIKKGEYYKLSVDVWTDLILDETKDNSARGAAIVVTEGSSATSAIIAQKLSVNTENQWKTYTLYIEGSDLQSKDFYVQLWLGYGPAKFKTGNSTDNTVDSPYIVKGTAMFDNVMLTKITAEDFDGALVAQYNALYPTAIVSERNADTQKVLSVNNDMTAVVSMTYANRNFVYGSGLSATSNTRNFYGAKQSGASGYTLTVGKEDLEDSSEFPSYSSETDAAGIFDLTKLYYAKTNKDTGAVEDPYADAFRVHNSGFKAPDHESLNVTYEDGKYKFSRPDNPADTNALLVYHKNNAISGAGFVSNSNLQIEKNKYYAISVWVYIWVPSLGDKGTYTGEMPTDTEAGDYQTKLDTYNKKVAEYDRYTEYVSGGKEVYATLRLSGATTDYKPEVKSDGTFGGWQKITLKVRGNELANRNVKLEMWYGNGEWNSDTLYPGGCIFDNVSIEVFATEEGINAAYATGEIAKWGEVASEAYEGFGLTGATADFTALTADATSGWTYSLVDNKTYVDMTATNSNLYAGIVSGNMDWTDTSANLNVALNGIAKPGDFAVGGTVFDYVMLNHAQYTASKLTFKPADTDTTTLKTEINRFYRLSMWVNTQNLKSGSTFKITVYDKETDSAINSSATQSSLALTDWTEISFVFRADDAETDSMYLVVEFGSGDIYTPASHAKGAIFITAPTWTRINYSEYKNASGDYLKSINLANSSSTDSSITNSDFANVSDDNFDIKDGEEDVFDVDGKMIGIAKPTGWTRSSIAYAIETPKVDVKSSELTWKHSVKEVTHYYIYRDKVAVNTEGKTENKKLVKIIAADDSAYYTEDEETQERTYKYKPETTYNYYVRAVVDGTTVYASDLSSSKKVSSTATTTAEAYISNNAIENAIANVKGGIVNVENYPVGADFYPADTEGKLAYRSPSPNVLTVKSDYPTYVGYTNSSSASLSANSYYRLSVWVKTVDGAKASVTIKNSSKILDAPNGYVGHVNIDTEGKWVRYDIYIVTNMSSASLTLELFLGNKYAKNEVALSTEEGATKVTSGLSKGTVYFDDVMLTKLADEEAYNALATAGEKNTALNLLDKREATGSFYNNEYRFTTVDYHTDSFDNSTKNTNDDTAAEALLGSTPGAYNHDTQNPVYNTDGEVADDDHPNHVYGVYNRTDDLTDLLNHLTDKSYESTAGHAVADRYTREQLEAFLTAGTEGNENYLMMANVTRPSAQFYKSTSMTMSADAYYKVTFKAKFLSPVDGKNAEFRFIYNSSANKWESISIGASDDMVEYTFYYANKTTSSVTAYLGFYLGSNDAKEDAEKVQNYVSGILVIDDVSVAKMSEEKYTEEKTATEADETLKGKYASFTSEAEKETPVEDDEEKDEEQEDTEEKKNNINAQVWLILSSVVIGVILVAVIVVLLYRKLKGKVDKKLRKVKVESKMPADLEAKKATNKEKGDRKKDVSTSDYDD